MKNTIIKKILIIVLCSALSWMIASSVSKQINISKPKAERVITNSKPTKILIGKNSVKVSLCLRNLLKEYVVLADKYGIDLGELSGTKFIAHTDIYRYHKRSAYGITYTNRISRSNHIMIDNSVSHVTQTFVKVVFYHELFHLLSKKGHVKNPNHPYILRQGGDINVEYAIKNFDKKEISEYFKFLKKVQENNIKL